MTPVTPTTSNAAPADGTAAGDARPAAPPWPSSARGDLLISVVAVARSAFGAAASSVLRLDRDQREFVFAAVAGEGEDFLVGRRFPADRGIAGWVAATGEATIVDQVAASVTFARDVAESTGYVPESIMAAQIAHADESLGVLEVLDATRSPASLGDLELLKLLAGQAAIALRDPEAGPEATDPGERVALEGLIRLLENWDAPTQQAAGRILQTLATFFRGRPAPHEASQIRI